MIQSYFGESTFLTLLNSVNDKPQQGGVSGSLYYLLFS